MKEGSPINNSRGVPLAWWCCALISFAFAISTTQAQFNYTTNNNQLTITGYSGSGGDVALPDNVGGLPVTGVATEACWFNSNIVNLTITNTSISVGPMSFYRCYLLTNVTIGSGVTNIGLSAFGYDQNLLAINVDPANSVYTSVNGVVFDTTQSTLIQCPGGFPGGYAVPNSVSVIASNAFQYCTAITSVVVPDSVTYIQDSAFSNCGMTNIALGTNVGTIEGNAFFQSQLRSITLPASVTNIGLVPFHFCQNLTAINVDPANPAYTSVDGMLLDKAQLNVIECAPGKTGAYTLPATVTNLGTFAFAGCRATNLVMNNGLLSIGNSCFTGSGFKGLTFPDSLTNVGPSGFNGSPVTNVTFGTGLASIGDYGFASCAYLSSVCFRGNAPTLGGPFVFSSDGAGIGRAPIVYYAPGTTGWSNTFGGIATAMWDPVSQCVLSATNNTFTITGYLGNSNSVVIPSTINGLPVVSLGNSAFQTHFPGNNPTSISIPASVTNIGAEAFMNCNTLGSVNFSNVKTLGAQAFYECRALTSIDLSSVTNIGPSAFSGCTALTNVVLSPKLVLLGQAAFSGCTSLRSIIIPAGVLPGSAMYDTFSGCTNLTSIYFMGNAPGSPVSPFYNDTKLTVYYLPGTKGWTNTYGGRPAVLWNPQPAAPLLQADGFGFIITGPSNVVIVVEGSSTLGSSSWIPLSTNTLTNGSAFFKDFKATNFNPRYYRLRSP